MPYFDTDGTRLYYQDWGAGRPIVFVHGWAFGGSWEKNTIAAPGIRVVMTHALPFFPAMAVYAALVRDGNDEYVELLDIVVDRDYFNLIEDDPS